MNKPKLNRHHRVILTHLLLPLCCRLLCLADPLDHWTQRNQLPTGEDIFGITYIAGSFLASASQGGILSSPDGVNWKGGPVAPTNTVTYSINSIAYGSGLYLAVGVQGQVLTSSNAMDWTPQWSGVNAILESAAYGTVDGKGRFVIVGSTSSGRASLTSDDGIHFSVRRLSDEGALWQVIFNQGQFYTVGNFGVILSSGDGVTWRQFTAPQASRLNGIASGNGRLVVVGGSGQFLTSTNGTSWTTNGPSLHSGYPSVTFGDGRFLIVDDDRTWISTNGVAWTSQTTVGLSSIRAVTQGGGKFVGVGSSGFVATSADGFQWISQSHGTNVLFEQVAVGNGIVLATGEGSVMVGPNAYQGTTPLLKTRDGTNWSDAGIDSNYAPIGLAFANGQFVVFARDNRNSAPVFVLTSSDGITWARNDIDSTGAALRVIYANGRYVAVGGGIFASSDGQRWTTQPAGPFSLSTLTGVAYGNGRFVAVGNEDPILISTNGLTWSSLGSGTNGLTDIAFGNGKFVAIGNGYLIMSTARGVTTLGEILTSTDGEHWTAETTPFGNALGFEPNRIVYGGGWFVIVGSGGEILTSPDGTNWTSRKSPTNDALNSLAYADGLFVAAGQHGTTVFSDNILAATLKSPASSLVGFSFATTGPRGQVYHVQANTDLKSTDWTEIGFVTNATGTATFSDTTGGRSRARFYRLLTQ